MPRYDYRCTAGHVYEKQQPFGSPAEHPCEKCGKPALRVLVAPPLVFKGGGFYKTAGRGGKGASAEAAGDSEPETKSYNSGVDEAMAAAAETTSKRKKTEKPEPAAKIKDE